MKKNNELFGTLFKNVIPKGRITIMVGEPSIGKSMWMTNYHMDMVKLKNELRIKKLNSLL